MRILGVDASLHNSGIAWRENGEIRTSLIRTPLPNAALEKANKIPTYAKNLNLIDDWLGEFFNEYEFDCVFLEGAAFGGKGWAVVRLTEVRGLIAKHCGKHGIPFLNITPASLKKAISGNGRASKEEMILSINQKTGLNLSDDNRADAVGLLLAGEAYMKAIEDAGLDFGTKFSEVTHLVDEYLTDSVLY